MNVVNRMISDIDTRSGKKNKSSRKKIVSWQLSSLIVLALGISTLSYTIWSFEKNPENDPIVQVAQFDKSDADLKPPKNMETLEMDTNFVPKVQTDKPAVLSNKSNLISEEKKQPTKSQINVKDKLNTTNKNIVAKNTVKPKIIIKSPDLSKLAKSENKLLKTQNGIPHKPTKPFKKNNMEKPNKIVLAKNDVSERIPLLKNRNTIVKADRVILNPVLKSSKERILVKKLKIKEPPVRILGTQLHKKSIDFTKTQKAKKYYSDALVKLNSGDTASAKILLKKSLKIKQENVVARKLLAGILINQKSFSDAKKTLIEGIKILPETSIFYHWLGRIYMEQGEFDQASVLLSDGSKFAQKGDYFALMALAQQNTDGYESAIESYKRALTIVPSQSKWWLGLGIVLEKIENWKDAENAYKTALLAENLPFKLHNKTAGRLAFVKNQIALLDD